MNETLIQILIEAFRISSLRERDAFVTDACSGDIEMQAKIRQVLLLGDRLEDETTRPDDAALRQKVEEWVVQLESPGHSAADQATGIMPADCAEEMNSQLQETVIGTEAAEGVKIGDRYVLQNKIGEGGMGEVWVARQISPVKRRVALKLIKKGMDSRAVLARFEQERQALALMDHPNIAQVLDGGVTESGQSYFVMELVNGLPLTQFADESKLNTGERLKLFVPICLAVQHAHQKGIIHRDLKPANIMVTMIDGRPVPKVIDFGVAKATAGSLSEESVETQFGAVIGTLEYMAPEQAGFSGVDIDTRADIYSLGVVLYELLTGLRPIDQGRLKEAGLVEMIRVIKEENPSRPSTRLSTSESLPSLAAIRGIDPRKLTALLKGELDWVVMKCLEKARDRRYDTAKGLARDIQRFLSGEIVEARPASAGYRLTKFVHRNRGLVVATGLVVGLLVAGVAGTTWGWIESRRSAELARVEAATQVAISQFLQDDILAQASSSTQGDSIFQPDPNLTVKTALDRAGTHISGRFAEQPLVAAALHRTIGNAYLDLGQFSDAQTHLEKSLTVYREYRSDRDSDVLLVMQQLGYLYLQQDKPQEAEELLVATRDSFQEQGHETRESLRAAMHLAHCYQTQAADDPGKLERAKKIYVETYEAQKNLLGEEDLDVSQTLFSLGMHQRLESFAKADPTMLDVAESTFQQVLDASEWLPEGHPEKLRFRYGLALIASDKKEYDRALRIREKVLDGCIRTFGEVHPTTARAMDSLALNYMMINRYAEAEGYYLKSLAARRKMYGNDHPMTEKAVFSIGQFYLNAGNMPKAEPYYRERLERNRRIRGMNSVDTHLASRDLAMILADLGQADEAEQILGRAILGLRSHFDNDHPIVLLTLEYHAEVLMGLGRAEEALPILEKGIHAMRGQANPDPIALASSIAVLGQCQLLLNRYVDAESSFRESSAVFARYIPDAWPSFAYRSRVGVALAGQKKFSEAESLLLESFTAIKARRVSVPPAIYIETIQAIVDLYDATERPAEAAKWRDVLEETSAAEK